jgi:hypothetical protein
MAIFDRKKQGSESRYERELRRKLVRLSQRELLDLTEATIGQLSISVLSMRQRSGDDSEVALAEAIRLNVDLKVILDELDSI